MCLGLLRFAAVLWFARFASDGACVVLVDAHFKFVFAFSSISVHSVLGCSASVDDTDRTCLSVVAVWRPGASIFQTELALAVENVSWMSSASCVFVRVVEGSLA